MNNKFVQEKNAKISIFDRSFKYGENVFETILLKNSKIIELNKHLLRLQKSANYLDLKIPFYSQELAGITLKLVTKNKLKNCLIRITLSRGEDKNNKLNIIGNSKNTLVITCTKFSGYKKAVYEKGIALKIVKRKKIDEHTVSPQAKIGASYLPNILAKDEALNSGFDEALFLDREENVLETTISNIFWIKGNIFFTPDIKSGIFPGITRENVLKLIKKEKKKIKVGKFQKKELLKADEVFLTYTSAGIMPVSKINSHKFKVGEKTKNLLKQFNNLSYDALSSKRRMRSKISKSNFL